MSEAMNRLFTELGELRGYGHMGDGWKLLASEQDAAEREIRAAAFHEAADMAEDYGKTFYDAARSGEGYGAYAVAGMLRAEANELDEEG